jgi:3D-(3,5/4)-trihydroxycyclohexane-1,2-dione acylhydrolase (decyclizing)
LAGAADVILAVGTRLQDFTTGSWTAFAADARFIGLNAAIFDAVKHRSLPLVADAREGLRELADGLSGWVSTDDWALRAKNATGDYHSYIDALADPSAVGESGRPTYAQVIGAVDRAQQPGDYVIAAAGGFPGELINGWRAKQVGAFDCEYGFSCMGYEISGAWGAKMARPNDEVITFVGDGSYMMMNSDLYSSVLSGHKLIVIVCDNGGFAVINRLQISQGGVPFNNQIENTRHHELVYVDFAAHAAAMGCDSERVASVHELEGALRRARHNDRTTVIALHTDAYAWTGGGAFWEVGVPEVSSRPEVQAARSALVDGLQQQRVGT